MTVTVKLLAGLHLELLSLKGGYTGLSESIHVKMPHCWKSHAAAHIFFYHLSRTYDDCLTICVNVSCPDAGPGCANMWLLPGCRSE